ncbi:TPA: pyridoxamine 5-phosphate oxidase, partial [Escherichia coli]|nr:pyridoxamine 5-phosphate oxidase [Escherichia coli]
FGFSFVIKEDAAIERKNLISKLLAAGIECRPIVTGNFLKNERVLSYFDYSVHDTVVNAEYIDKNGFFVGNHQIPLLTEIDYLRNILK